MISERIAVQFAGISMKTPVMGASGTFGFGVEYSDFLDLDHVGAIIPKASRRCRGREIPVSASPKRRRGCSTASAWKIRA